MADKNFQQELSALDRSAILKTTLWVMDQIESGTQNWRSDYPKLYPRFTNIDPLELLVNVAGYKDTTQVFAHISEIRMRLRDELEKLETQEEAQSTPPGQMPIGTAPPLPHNYYAVMAELDLLLERKRHQLALELTSTVVQNGIPHKLGRAVTLTDVDAIVESAVDDILTTIPYIKEQDYPSVIASALKKSIAQYPKTADSAPDLDVDQVIAASSGQFASQEKSALEETAVLAKTATTLTLIDPSAPSASIVGEEIRNAVDAYQQAANPEGNEIIKSQDLLETYAQNYISQFLIEVAPAITRKNVVKKGDIDNFDKKAHEFAFQRFEEELKKRYTPDELAFFRQNFMQRALGLARLQLGLVSPKQNLGNLADYATPQLAAISLTAVSAYFPQEAPEVVIARGSPLMSPLTRWLVPEAIRLDSAAAFFQSEPFSTDSRHNTIDGITQLITPTPIQPEERVSEEIFKNPDGTPNPQIDPSFPKDATLDKVLVFAQKHPRQFKVYYLGDAKLRQLVDQGLASEGSGSIKNYALKRILNIPTPSLAGIAVSQVKKSETYQGLRFRLILKRYQIQKKVVSVLDKMPPQTQIARNAARATFRLFSFPIKAWPGAKLFPAPPNISLTKIAFFPFRAALRPLGRLIPSMIKRPLSLVIRRVSQVASRVLKLGGRLFQRVILPILIASQVAKYTKKIAKILGGILFYYYLWLAQLGLLPVLIASLVAGAAGFVVGAIAGGILGFQLANMTMAALFPVGVSGIGTIPYLIAGAVIYPTFIIGGALIGGLITAGVFATLAAAVTAIYTGVFGAGAMWGGIIGTTLMFPAFLFMGPFALALPFLGAGAGWLFENIVWPFTTDAVEFFAAPGKVWLTNAWGALTNFISWIWGSIGSAWSSLMAGVSSFFGVVSGFFSEIFSSITGVLAVGGTATLITVGVVVIATTSNDTSTETRNLLLTKIAPAQVGNNSLVDYQLSVAAGCSNEIKLTDKFTDIAPLKSLQSPQIIDPRVESVTVQPSNLEDMLTTNQYTGDVTWTIKMKSAAPDSSCTSTVDPADQQFLPPDSLGLNPPSPVDSAKGPDMAKINDLKPIYLQAAQKTGMPWKFIAGIHFIEAGNNPDGSLSNGGPIGPGTDIDYNRDGTYNPTSARSYCSNVQKEGVPYNDGTHCYWPTLLDSAIWAATFLKEEKAMACYGKFTDWKDTICSFGAYNGYQPRYDGLIKSEIVKQGLNGYPTSYLDGIKNWWYNGSADPPFYKYGAYTVFMMLAKSASPGEPILPPLGDVKAKIKNEFGITMNGFDDQHLQWAYEKLLNVSTTNFIDLTRPYISSIEAKPYNPIDPISFAGIACPDTIRLVYGFPTDPEEIFKITLIHEMSHRIRKCTDNSISLYQEHLDARATEGGVTYYGEHASGLFDDGTANPNKDSNCPDGNPNSEDYADTITYYLNPSTYKQKDVCGTGRLPNPYDGSSHPLHKEVARRVVGNY